MFELRIVARTGVLVAVLALASPACAFATDWGRYPSFHYMDVDKRAGRKASKTPEVVPAPRVSSGSDATVHVVDQPLKEFLTSAGRRLGVRIAVAAGVRGTIRNERLPAQIEPMLDELAARFDFIWFRDGDAIQVTLGSEAVSRVIFIGRRTFEDFRQAIADAGVAAGSFALSYVESSNSVVVKGPASLVARIELLAEAGANATNGVRLIRHGKAD